MNNIKSIFPALIAGLFIFSSCSEKKEDPQPASMEEDAYLHIHTLAGNQTITYNTVYQHNGRNFLVTDFRYYLSNVVLLKSDGSELKINDEVFLVDPSKSSYLLGKVPVGSYKGFRFTLGLDSATNHSDPTVYPSGHPLAPQSPSVHWNWNTGYIFMKFDGRADTTMAGTNPPNKDIFYHVGTDALSRTIDFSNSPFSVASGGATEIGLEFDLLDVLDGVDMMVDHDTHTMNNPTLAALIADNWPDAWEIE